MQGKKILVIDDDPHLVELIKTVLSHAQATVYTATSGLQGLRLLYTHQPDLVFLDLMMPEMDGWQVCQRIRQFSRVPIIMFTALDQDEDIIRGLTVYEADDYLIKPIASNVLLARAKALLRRTESLPPNETLFYQDNYLTIASAERRVYVRDQLVKLSATEYRLLLYLIQNAGRVLTFHQILENVWGESRNNIEYVHAYIWHLRQKLEADPRHPIYILTEYGVGYSFEKQKIS